MSDKELTKRMETNEEGNSFITMKGHKENFDNHATVWQITPAKNELEIISILILDKINKKSVKNSSWINGKIPTQ